MGEFQPNISQPNIPEFVKENQQLCDFTKTHPKEIQSVITTFPAFSKALFQVSNPV